VTRRRTVLVVILIPTSVAVAVYVLVGSGHHFRLRAARPDKVVRNSGEGFAGAPLNPAGVEKVPSERRWDVGRPYDPRSNIDGDELLTDPTVPPLMRALHLGDMGLAKSLIAAGANVNGPDRHGNTALMIAANRAELGALRQLLRSGAAVDAKNEDALTALFFTDSRDIAKELIEHGADVNATSRFNITPLMVAVSYDPPIVRLLIANGANVNAKDVNGVTALMLAALHGRANNVKILIEAGAHVNTKDNKGGTALSRVQWQVNEWRPGDSESEPMTQNKKQLKDFRVIAEYLKRARATN